MEEERKKIVFDGLVIGGGIAGLQAALDLADQGYKVLIVEKEPSIGGKNNRLYLNDYFFRFLQKSHGFCRACFFTHAAENKVIQIN